MFPDYLRDDVFRLETARLWLRWPTAGDAPFIERLAGEGEVAHWTANIPHPYPAGAAEKFVLKARASNSEGSGLTLTMALKQKPQAPVGLIELRWLPVGPQLGYWLGRPYWGSGLMAEAIADLTAFVWLATDVERIVADAMVDNGRSRHALERAGFVPMGERPMLAPARGKTVAVMGYELRREAHVGAAPAGLSLQAAQL
ncbi:MAG: GNAT family N-acetyltransferase [Hyphomicrobiales bacterium]|nr:GNAT family N-acetyltransferase [Hyphomicrobiales bacterium]